MRRTLDAVASTTPTHTHTHQLAQLYSKLTVHWVITCERKLNALNAVDDGVDCWRCCYCWGNDDNDGEVFGLLVDVVDAKTGIAFACGYQTPMHTNTHTNAPSLALRTLMFASLHNECIFGLLASGFWLWY